MQLPWLTFSKVGVGMSVGVGESAVGWWGRRGMPAVVGQTLLQGSQPVGEGTTLLHSDCWVDEGVTEQLAGILQGGRLLAAS